jgi:O-antigen/teichoic acid export membrane protein
VANAFSKILQLSVGDFIAKALSFLAFVYLARTLDVRGYGELEFANALIAYFLLLSDGGLEGWGVREIARTGNVLDLAGRVTALRLVLATLTFLLLLSSLLVIPDQGQLRTLLLIFGIGLFAQALTLKWVFMAEQQMSLVAVGLMAAQVVFAVCVFAGVRGPGSLLLVAAIKVASDLMQAGYFAWQFRRTHGRFTLRLRREDRRVVLAPALMMGLSTAMSMINYNFDSALLGFIRGQEAVGWYNAAYRPVTAALALPLTYFLGLFPVLARAYAIDVDEFRRLITHSLRLASTLAVPIGVGGTMMAGPIILQLFGPVYAPAVPVLQVLAWSAALVVLRGTFRHGLTVTGHVSMDLRIAMLSAALNVLLNVILIPRYGMLGAATATVAAETAWLLIIARRLRGVGIDVALISFLWRPVTAGAGMALFLYSATRIPWVVQGVLACLLYLVVLLAVSGKERQEWVAMFVSHRRPAA